jgi:hypothetical protein
VGEGGIAKFEAVPGQIASNSTVGRRVHCGLAGPKSWFYLRSQGRRLENRQHSPAARSSVRSALPAGRFQIMHQVDNSDVKAAQVDGLDLQPGHLD